MISRGLLNLGRQYLGSFLGAFLDLLTSLHPPPPPLASNMTSSMKSTSSQSLFSHLWLNPINSPTFHGFRLSHALTRGDSCWSVQIFSHDSSHGSSINILQGFGQPHFQVSACQKGFVSSDLSIASSSGSSFVAWSFRICSPGGTQGCYQACPTRFWSENHI